MTTTQQETEPLPQVVTLGIVASIAVLGWVVLGLWATRVDTSSLMYRDPDLEQIALQAALSWWAGFCMYVAITTGTGILVLTGVRTLLRRGGSAV